MPELELTWGYVLKIWWAAAWRAVVFGNLCAGAVVGIVGIALLIIGHREWGQHAGMYELVAIIAWFLGSLMGLRLALKANYRDFRIVLVPPLAV